MNPQGHQSGEARHEGRDVDVVSLVMIAAMLLLVIGVCFLICWAMLHALQRDRERDEPVQQDQAAEFPTPRLIIQPGSEEQRTQLAAVTKLETYGWVDRQAGVTHIPIGRAMQLLMERGLPEVGAGQTRLQLMQSRPHADDQPVVATPSPIAEGTP